VMKGETAMLLTLSDRNVAQYYRTWSVGPASISVYVGRGAAPGSDRRDHTRRVSKQN